MSTPNPLEENPIDTVTGFDWSVLLDKPLRVTVIILIALLAHVVLRVLIRRFTSQIVRGDLARSARGGSRNPLRRVGERLTPVEDLHTLERRSQRTKTVGSLLRSVSSIIISVIAILMVLAELDFNLGPILASAGVVGVAIGFGAQTLVKDYLSGIFLVLEDQYGIGDVIDLGEVAGTVEEVGLRITKVRGVDGTLWYMRNGEVLRVGNQSQGWARAVMDIRLPYDSDIERVEEIIRSTARDMAAEDRWNSIITEEPEVWGVESLTGDAVTIRLVIKTKPMEQWAVARAFRPLLKTRLDAAGIKVPMPVTFPQQPGA